VSSRPLPPLRLLAVVAPVSIAGVAAYIAATLVFVTEPLVVRDAIGVGALLAASILAERYPVPVADADANGVSLGFVFAVTALVLFGWPAATFVYASAPTIVALVGRKPLIRTTFNAGVFGLAGTLAGALTLVPGSDTGAVTIQIAVTGATLYTANMLLVSAAIAASSRDLSFFRLLASNTRLTALPFALMASTALMLVSLWQRTPLLSAALVGPLIAISLYQRSAHRALSAMRLALTDPLTGLGNHRHFHERLESELADAERLGTTVSVCFIDVDDFKRVNDTFGHPAGDGVLSQVAGKLRQGGEAFRLGGDEFAVLLPGAAEPAALEAAASIVARVAAADLGEIGAVTISAGVATYPHQGGDRGSLVGVADAALYRAKEHGKNQVRTPRSNVVELPTLPLAHAVGV
jgi:diguanylate cyclase (GGDEF)-like protein